MLGPVHIMLPASDLRGYVFQLPAVGQKENGMIDACVCVSSSSTYHAMFSRGSLCVVCVIGGVCGNLMMGAGQVDFASVQGANCPVAFCLFFHWRIGVDHGGIRGLQRCHGWSRIRAAFWSNFVTRTR
ncbi:hypothetical protein VPH35_046963 [Triticum aestivum]